MRKPLYLFRTSIGTGSNAATSSGAAPSTAITIQPTYTGTIYVWCTGLAKFNEKAFRTSFSLSSVADFDITVRFYANGTLGNGSPLYRLFTVVIPAGNGNYAFTNTVDYVHGELIDLTQPLGFVFDSYAPHTSGTTNVLYGNPAA